ncbi:hypothetical protein [Kitasatospora sp. NPDC093679]|uniref:hypothetical protein n=1 Tax=Kitasatospora sp. NPDC093679 TaxID=3154983 RepID=UPI00342BFB1A
MAGDLNIHELAVMDAREAPPAPPDPQSALPGATPVLHRYGRVNVVQPTGGSNGATEVPDDELPLMTQVEALGVKALRLRETPTYRAVKRARPRDGELWTSLGSCTTVVPTPEVDLGAPGFAGAPAPAPTSSYLEGSVAVGIVIVEGPTADLQFTEAERTKVVAEVQNGLSWYSTTNPAAGITFTYDIQIVRIDTAADPGAADLEALWRDPAMGALGYSADWNGVVSYVNDIRNRFGTRWTYCGFFTKYPLVHFAYASIGGPRIVMDYANDGWGPDNIDRVFAHETGHIFGCPDEYAASGCDCGGSWGRFGTPNSNCENCAADGVDCLMRANTFALCSRTPSHLGWATNVAGNPALLQGRFGLNGNFELTVPSAYDGIDFLWRNNDDPNLPWGEPTQFGQELGRVDALTMIQSNYGSPGNLELIARARDTLQFFWRDSGPDFHWNGPYQIATGAAGNPALIQSRFGQQGNFELVFPAAGGGITFMWRNNDDPAMPWSAPFTFAQDLGQVDALTMIQSNYGSPGNLELIARARDTLQFFWRDSGLDFHWNGPYQIATGAAGNPALIQSRFGQQGNFELVFPAAGGGITFMWRNNDDPAMPWSAPFTFAQDLGQVDALTMIQSNFGSPGNLELIARARDTLQFFWRDSGPDFHWNGPWRLL